MSLPPDFGYLLDHYLAHLNEFRDSERAARKAEEGTDQQIEWYASSLGKCLRQQYLRAHGAPERDTIDAKARRTFAWGDHVEDFVRAVYRRLGLVVPPANPRMSYGSLVARGDIVLRFPPEDVDDIPIDVLTEWSPQWVQFLKRLRDELPTDWDGIVWSEIKSSKSTAMRWLKDEGARYAHRIQVGASMFIAGQDPSQLPVPVDHWQVEYVGKDAVGVLRFSAEDSWAVEAEARWRLLEAADHASDLPCECECLCKMKRGGHSKAKGKFCWQMVCPFWDGDFDQTGTCCDPYLLERKSA